MRTSLQLVDDPHSPRGESQFFAARLLGRHLPLLKLPCVGSGEADLGSLDEGTLVLFCFAGVGPSDEPPTDAERCLPRGNVRLSCKPLEPAESRSRNSVAKNER